MILLRRRKTALSFNGQIHYKFFCLALLVLLLFLGFTCFYPENARRSPCRVDEEAKPHIPQKYGHLQALREIFNNSSRNELARKYNEDSGPGVYLSDLEELKIKQRVILVVIVSSAAARLERREAIRDTWWKKCHGEVVCKFFTDGIGLTNSEEIKLSEERLLNKDIEFQPLKMGRSFGMRYLYHIMFATAKYDFKYLLRIDDDYFVCLERLLNELPYRPDNMFSWGSYHCQARDLIYMDEAWTLYSADVIDRFLSQDPRKIMCHPHADQQIAVWINKLYTNVNETLVKFHDRRLHHYPPAREKKEFKTLIRVCDKYTGIHGTSPEMMRNFWRNSSDSAKKITHITDVTKTCRIPDVFNISKIRPPYRFDLRPCIENPIWAPNEEMWLGIRLGGKKLSKVAMK